MRNKNMIRSICRTSILTGCSVCAIGCLGGYAVRDNSPLWLVRSNLGIGIHNGEMRIARGEAVSAGDPFILIELNNKPYPTCENLHYFWKGALTQLSVMRIPIWNLSLLFATYPLIFILAKLLSRDRVRRIQRFGILKFGATTLGALISVLSFAVLVESYTKHVDLEFPNYFSGQSQVFRTGLFWGSSRSGKLGSAPKLM